MIPVLRRALAVVVSASAMTILSGGLPLVAQESGKAVAETKKKVVDPSRRVPNYFGQLGLTEDQRESIYKIQAKHQPQIDALENQLEELRAQALKDCEAVLTADQKRMLGERRASAAGSRAKKRSTVSVK